MYAMTRQITYSQVGSDLHTDMAILVHLFQDCTLFHAEAVGKGLNEVDIMKKAWFLLSWQVKVFSYPSFGDTITVRTWPHAFKGTYGYRNFDLLDEDGNQLAIANSIWAFMDIKTLHPIKPGDEDLRGYDMEPALDMEYAPRKIKLLPEDNLVKQDAPIMVKRTFLDSNMHVNNGRYVAEAMNYIPEDKKLDSMRVDYRRAAMLGDQMYPFVYESKDRTSCQIVFADGDKLPYVIVEAVYR